MCTVCWNQEWEIWVCSKRYSCILHFPPTPSSLSTVSRFVMYSTFENKETMEISTGGTFWRHVRLNWCELLISVWKPLIYCSSFAADHLHDTADYYRLWKRRLLRLNSYVGTILWGNLIHIYIIWEFCKCCKAVHTSSKIMKCDKRLRSTSEHLWKKELLILKGHSSDFISQFTSHSLWKQLYDIFCGSGGASARLRKLLSLLGWI